MGCSVRLQTVVLALLLAGCTAAGTQPKASEPRSSTGPGGEETMVTNAGPVVVAPEVVDGWRFLYRFITEVEFVLCLEGKRDGGKIVIDGFRLARMEAANISSVRYQPCTSDRYIGTAHNHPPVTNLHSLCYQSLPDRRSFEADKRAQLDIVLCGEDKFLWVTRDNGHQQQGEATIVVAATSP